MPRAAKPVPVEAPAPGGNYPVITDKATIAACAEYVAVSRTYSEAEKRKKALKKLIEDKMAGAPVAYAGPHVIVLTAIPPIPPTPDQVITKAHIGQTIPGSSGRAGYSQLTVR